MGVIEIFGCGIGVWVGILVYFTLRADDLYKCVILIHAYLYTLIEPRT